MSQSYLSVSAFARTMATSRQQVHRWIAAGEIPVVRIGRLIRIDAEAAKAFVERHSIGKSRAAQ